MSHAEKADRLLIKPAAGARPAPPCRTDGSFARHARRPVTRRVTSSTETPGWRRPQTDRPAESHSHPSQLAASNGKGFTASGRTAPTTLQNAALRLESPLARSGPEGLAAARVPPSSARELSSAYVRRFASRTSCASQQWYVRCPCRTQEAPLAGPASYQRKRRTWRRINPPPEPGFARWEARYDKRVGTQTAAAGSLSVVVEPPPARRGLTGEPGVSPCS
jgi:hypothetical protein